ncbi:hypothetical protein [Nocardia brevicatena]|uniref:hypothetical protein n=1 Tax=Nocardia brevicatena TaxID=37327 RepID=UPI000594DBE0|nr:hypothetical protein [Nocardia brevicatena]
MTQAYNTVYYPVWDKAAGRIALQAAPVDEDGKLIAARVEAKLQAMDKLRTVIGPRVIRYDLDKNLSKVWEVGHVTFGDLWKYYCRFPYLGRLRNRKVLEEGVRAVLDELTGGVEGFALASEFDEATGRYIELLVPGTGVAAVSITDRTLLVDLNRAKAQLLQERKDQEQLLNTEAQPSLAANPSVAGKQGGDDSGNDWGQPPSAVPQIRNTRFWGSMKINPERFGRDLSRLSQDLLALLTAPEGVELQVSVEIKMERADGFPDDTVMKVVENLGHLKVKGQFEDR